AYEIVTRDVWRIAGVRRRAVLLGSGERLVDLRRALGHGRGGIDDDFDGALLQLGGVDDLVPVLEREHPDELIVSSVDVRDDDLLDLVEQANRAGVKVRIAPTTMELLTQRAEYVPGQGVPLFELRPPVFAGLDWATKRVFDIVVSC